MLEKQAKLQEMKIRCVRLHADSERSRVALAQASSVWAESVKHADGAREEYLREIVLSYHCTYMDLRMPVLILQREIENLEEAD